MVFVSMVPASIAAAGFGRLVVLPSGVLALAVVAGKDAEVVC